ncbi:MAG: hypothetical protein H7839_20025 [Magnetococcus sp. YQC-5]
MERKTCAMERASCAMERRSCAMERETCAMERFGPQDGMGDSSLLPTEKAGGTGNWKGICEWSAMERPSCAVERFGPQGERR